MCIVTLSKKHKHNKTYHIISQKKRKKKKKTKKTPELSLKQELN